MVPAGIVATGFPAVEATCARIGLRFDGWQERLNRLILAKVADGFYAADMVAMSIPRQVGKTWDVGALCFADAIIHPGSTQVWTAHRFKVARETFDELRSVAESPAMRAHIDPDQITTAAGNECIRFRNGSRIVFAARERGAIRGFTKVMRLVLDEAQILTEAALSDLVPTMNQAHNPQVILMGTPPKPTDPSEVLTRLRQEALDGDTEGVLWVEMAAEPGADPDDREAWAQANPSYPSRTTDRAMLRMRKALSDDDFLREALGIWDESTGAEVFGSGLWEACAEQVMPEGVPVQALGVAANVDLTAAAVVAAGVDGEGAVWVRPLASGRNPGDWLPRVVRELQVEHGVQPVFEAKGPVRSFAGQFDKAGVDAVQASADEYLDACAAIFTLVQTAGLRHCGYADLDAALRGAVKQASGDRWRWARRKSAADISPLEAATLASWAVARAPSPEPFFVR